MKKLGFIDLYIDEWHANTYPGLIKKSRWNDQVELTFAWEEKARGEKDLQSWCSEFGIRPADSIEHVVEECDGIIVLAPSNPEVHERLAELPLASGKPVYIDKPFAPDKAAAVRMFERAKRFKTPLMSSSALRFVSDLEHTVTETLKDKKVIFAEIHGGGSSFWEYSIHQIEMLMRLMGVGARRVMQCGVEDIDHMVIDYGDKRKANITRMDAPFRWKAWLDTSELILCTDCGDFFQNFVDAVLEFVIAGRSPIPETETIEIAALVEAGIKALKTPGEWVNV